MRLRCTQRRHKVSRKQKIIKQHLPHGVELHHTEHSQQIAEFRCEGCNRHLCWASAEDIKIWCRCGAALSPAVSVRDNISIVKSNGGVDEN